MADRNSKKLAYNEMMVHVPLCSHIDPKTVLVVGEVDDEFKAEVAKHDVEATYLDSLNTDDVFDVILYNCDTLDEQVLAQVNRCLEPKCGIFNTKSTPFHTDLEKMKAELTLIGESFWISMPYKFGHDNAILASKKFHPQAEIVLQVSDLLPDCNYYNTELHNAVFVYPQYIHKELTGIARR